MKHNFKCILHVKMCCLIVIEHETKPGPVLNQKSIITQEAICLALPCLACNDTKQTKNLSL
jgi:hypothetical protein